MAHPTSEWSLLRDKYYRKHEVYTMLWKSVDLSNYLVSGAKYGGPVAMIRDDSQRTSPIESADSLHPYLYTFTSAGRLIQRLEWDRERIVSLGWTEDERLVTVLENGFVRLYQLYGEYTQLSLGKEAKDFNIISAEIFGSGMVAMTGNFKLISISNWDEPRPKMMADPELSVPPHSWTVIPPQFSLSRHPEVLLSTGSTILVVDQREVQDQLLAQPSLAHLTLSPHYKFLAMYVPSSQGNAPTTKSGGKLWVVSSDFQKNLSEFPITTSLFPEYISPDDWEISQLVWCGIDSLLLSIYHPQSACSTVVMVAPFGDHKSYAYDSFVHLIPEIDGVRVLSATHCDWIGKVSDPSLQTFLPGSTYPSAVLYDAMDHYENKSPHADELIRSLMSSGQLIEAVENCIKAAGEEWDVKWQQGALKAASFGKTFLQGLTNPLESNHHSQTAMIQSFHDMCETLRVLNAIRFYEIGIPLSYQQYRELSPTVVLNRIVNRHEHLLAFKIAEYLGLESDKILVHWAKTKIKNSTEDDDTLCRLIVSRIMSTHAADISYAEIAKTAYQVGHPRLATKLLDYEKNAGDQVPLLLSMQEDELALIKAIESVDTDLVHLTLLHLRRKLPLGELFRLLNTKPVAKSYLEKFAKQERDYQLLKDFWYQDDKRGERGRWSVMEGFDKDTDQPQRLEKFRDALKLFQEDKECIFDAKCLDSHIKLFQMQQSFESEISNQTFLDLSQSETIFKLVTLNEITKASKIKSEFKVPDKRYWWICVRALGSARNWAELEKLAKAKKSPIGYLPFVEVCISSGAIEESIKYIQKCDIKSRPELYLRISAFKLAAETMLQLKDMQSLVQLRSRCAQDVELAREIDGMIGQLRGR